MATPPKRKTLLYQLIVNYYFQIINDKILVISNPPNNFEQFKTIVNNYIQRKKKIFFDYMLHNHPNDQLYLKSSKSLVITMNF